MDIFNTYREQINYRMRIHYYMIKDLNKKMITSENNNIKIALLIKNNQDLNKKIINLTYSLIISYLIIIYLIFIK